MTQRPHRSPMPSNNASPKPTGRSVRTIAIIAGLIATGLLGTWAVQAVWRGDSTDDTVAANGHPSSSTAREPNKDKPQPAPPPQDTKPHNAPPQEAAAEHHKYTNHLIHETSPYLLQHAHNPVNWYPWGEEALAKAKAENKPIFLSVGYSTCYWCHVMEKQCFESEEVAEILNKYFVAIKVDREERPDIDEQYMIATQLVSGRGGWPNSVWLTPDGRPFMAGTYFPKEQFIAALNTLADYWQNRRDDIEQQADRIAEAIRRSNSMLANRQTLEGANAVDRSLIDRAIAEYAQSFDATHGGFGTSPKFPPHGVLRVLIEEYQSTHDASLLDMITRTLDAMWLGGIHDHIGGGFHRYSTDGEWLLPHFEKMLYDNAQLMRSYADAFAITGHARYRDAVDDIYEWVRREMTAPGGAFFSAIDSGDVGREGEVYLWPYQDVVDVLGKEDAALFTEVYHVQRDGNFHEESTGKKPGTNIVHLTQPLATIAKQRGFEVAAFEHRMAEMRAKLLARRNTWEQPRKDDKILTSWNGLMIGALADAGVKLHDARYTAAATDAANFVLAHLVDERGRLLRTFRDNQAKLPGYLDDYAYFIEALLDLHTATGDAKWLAEARRLTTIVLDDFADQTNGGFFLTSNEHDDLLVRSKGLMGSGNVPSPNGIVVADLLRLYDLTNEADYGTAAEKTLQTIAGLMWQSPRSLDSGIYAAALAVRQNAKRHLDKVAATDADATQKFGPVTAHLFASHLQVPPGGELQVALALDIDDGWHLYGPNAGVKFVVPTEVSFVAHPAFTVESLRPPRPDMSFDPVAKQMLATYHHRVWYLANLHINEDAAPGEIQLTIQIKSQACDESRCLEPRTDQLMMTITVSSEAPPDKPRHAAVFQNAAK